MTPRKGPAYASALTPLPGTQPTTRSPGHTLPPLVAGIREAFTEAGWEWHWPNTTVETWADFEEVMADLASLDPASFSFRYPVSLKGQSTAVEGFGLASTVATLEHLAESLDTAVFGMSAEASRESSPP